MGNGILMADDPHQKTSDLLKSLGLPTERSAPKPSGSSTLPPAGGKSTADAAPVPDAPKFDADEYRRNLYNNDWTIRATVGASKALASIPVGIARLAGNVPQLADIAERVRKTYPMADQTIRNLEGFVDSPSRSWAETAGYGIGTIAGFAGTPGVGAERAAAWALPRFWSRFPPYAFRGGQFVTTPAARIGNAAGTAARATDTVAKGAIAGAVSDPDHPLEGAAMGAAGGAVPGVLSPAMRSRTMRSLGGSMAASMGGEAILQLMLKQSVPWYAIWPVVHNVRWHTRPVGAMLHRVGNNIVDQAGRIVGEIPGGSAGAIASQQERLYVSPNREGE
jgi:hypothetical protein